MRSVSAYMIKQATAENYNDIVRIYNQAVVTGVQTADEKIVSVKEKLSWLELHTGEHYIIYVESINSNIVGYLALSPYRHGRSAFLKTAEISFYVDSQYQRKGIGKKLIEHAISQCSDLNIDALIAILLSCNIASIAILKTFNFEKWGTMPKIAKLKSGDIDHLYYGINLV